MLSRTLHRLSIGLVAVAACVFLSGCPAGATRGGGDGATTGPDGEYFGSCSGNGSGDELALLNSSPIEVTITIDYPDGTSCDETIVTSGGGFAGALFTTVTITETNYELDDIYSFTASAPGVLPSETVSCIVNDVVIDNGIANADVQLSGLPGAAQQLIMRCEGGNWLSAP